MAARKQITRDDILSLDEFEKIRRDRRAELIERKRNRRVSVGPYATFYFENFDTMWWQIHEMLRTERGGEEQIADELAAYNPLIPQGRELVTTFMIEIADPARRDQELRRLGGIEDSIFIQVGDETIRAVADAGDDVERTRQDGKTSSVHFLKFPFTEAQIAAFRDPAVKVVIGVEHENYGHMTVLPANVRDELAGDFDG